MKFNTENNKPRNYECSKSLKHFFSRQSKVCFSVIKKSFNDFSKVFAEDIFQGYITIFQASKNV